MVTMGAAQFSTWQAHYSTVSSLFLQHSPLLQRGLGLEASDLCGMDSAGWDTAKEKGRPHVHEISRADSTKSYRFAHKPINTVSLHGLMT